MARQTQLGPHAYAHAMKIFACLSMSVYAEGCTEEEVQYGRYRTCSSEMKSQKNIMVSLSSPSPPIYKLGMGTRQSDGEARKWFECLYGLKMKNLCMEIANLFVEIQFCPRVRKCLDLKLMEMFLRWKRWQKDMTQEYDFTCWFDRTVVSGSYRIKGSWMTFP